MAKDPAFLFYPGDYLRDTQCLSEPVQVAYDRIMCEHMRNICISKTRLHFFTKKLAPEEIEELKSVLTEIPGGFQITWVAESITKYNAFRESRKNNRSKKNKEHINNTSSSYVKHMENESVIDIKSKDKGKVQENHETVERLSDIETNYTEYPDEVLARWKPFEAWLNDSAPRVQQLSRPITIDSYSRNISRYESDEGRQVLTAMHNRKTLLKDYVDANLTFLNWLGRRKPAQSESKFLKMQKALNRS